MRRHTKVTVLSKLYTFKALTIKISASCFFLCFAGIDRLVLEFIWKCKGPRIAQTISKNKVGELPLPYFSIYYTATSTDSVVFHLKPHAINSRGMCRNSRTPRRKQSIWAGCVVKDDLMLKGSYITSSRPVWI